MSVAVYYGHIFWNGKFVCLFCHYVIFRSLGPSGWVQQPKDVEALESDKQTHWLAIYLYATVFCTRISTQVKVFVIKHDLFVACWRCLYSDIAQLMYKVCSSLLITISSV